MPSIDITDLLSDPDFTTTIQLRVRQETVGPNGRATYQDTCAPVTAIVQPARGRDLVREDGSSRSSGTLAVWCKMGLTTGELSDAGQRLGEDHFQYRNRSYTVVSVEDWLEWGDGFVKAIAEQDALT